MIMKRLLIFLFLLCAIVVSSEAFTTLPLKGSVIKPTDSHLRYSGRISFKNPQAPSFTYPGVQISARFQGTSVKMITKPKSGYFMVKIDDAQPFKVSCVSEKDSVTTLAVALSEGEHDLKIVYAIEGYEFRPDFRGLILDEGCKLVDVKDVKSRNIEFIGNSITCGYGNESMNANDPFDYATENHYYSYAAITARTLEANEMVIARSGIGVYRNYDGPKTGSDVNMRQQYEYTFYNDKSEKWDFRRCSPDVICINLGTNDTSTKNYDAKLFYQAYKDFVRMVRSHNPKSKIVLLCGSMLNGEELDFVKSTLNDIAKEYNDAGDKDVYRFDFTPQTGELYYGADYHPSIWQHEKMAAELVAYLRTLMRWF